MRIHDSAIRVDATTAHHAQRGRADMEFWALLALAAIGFAAGWWWLGSVWWGVAGFIALPLAVGLLVFAISWVVTRNE